MGRIRTVKPGVFKHEDLFDAEQETGLPLRLAFIGLWTQCDREGRFAWRPRQLKTDILPYDDVDFSRVLDALATRGFIVKYACGTDIYGCIPSWHRHQVINNRERDSEIPSPDDEHVVSVAEPVACLTRASRDTDLHEGKGKELEGKGREGNMERETRAREIDGEFHDAFWAAYPHKVGKADALKAFRTARKDALLTEIMEGLRKYIHSKPPDRQWCNPATWLRQQRWLDEPAPPVNGTGPPKTRTQEATERLFERHGVFDERTDAIRNG